MKRVLNFILFLPGLALMSPYPVCIAAIIRLADGRPILFHQQRVGGFISLSRSLQ
ncbi:sugar transferase [candidate division KSB1 bacterium]|nr:sugar transferase [candidate division KSB1 bacterium]